MPTTAVKDKPLAELLDPAKPMLRWHQRQAWEKEIKQTTDLLAANATTERKFLANAQRIHQQNERQKTLLAEQTPRPLSAVERDEVAKLESELLREIRVGMVSQVDQRRGPPGTKDQQRAWHERNKAKILTWKKCRLLLNPDSQDLDLCNLERYRPEGPVGAAMTDADLPGVFALSAQAKANYDRIDWRDPEFQAQLEQAIKDGKLTINYHAKASDVRSSGVEVGDVTDTGDMLRMTVEPKRARGRGRRRGRPRKSPIATERVMGGASPPGSTG